MTGEKRGYAETGERLELGSKKLKMRDLDSVLRSEEIMQGEAVHPTVNAATRLIDLNANFSAGSNVVGNGKSACIEETKRVPSFGSREKMYNSNSVKSRGFALDLNAEDVSSSINHNPFYPYKNEEHLKSRDESECASSVGPLEEKDPMRVWKEMKQNGFLSSSHGGVPMPKPRGRKTKSDTIKKKMEMAKREQVDRFAKIAAPSGLLNGLNPGIINHVRNSKQVHSIIEALVRSEKLENGNKQGCQTKYGTQEFSERKCEPENVHDSGSNKLMNRSVAKNSERTGEGVDWCMIDLPYTFGRMSCPSHFNSNFEDDILALKLSSSNRIASENISSLTNDESASMSSMTSLSINAANVASQWLELLNQDVKGRLAALRRSKKRVRAVIQTELPYLESREFSSSQENNPCMTKGSVVHSNNAIADAHRTRWGSLFHQMDKTLCEEERQLESWWNQVKKMQVHCDQGLLKYKATIGLPQIDRLDDDCRLEKVHNLDRDVAVRAAAASIYSTCNFISSMENQPCC